MTAVSAVSISGASTVSEGAVISEGAAVSSVYSAGAVMAGLVSVSGLRVPTKCNARALSAAGWDCLVSLLGGVARKSGWCGRATVRHICRSRAEMVHRAF